MPVCVVGAEEAAPIFAHVDVLQRLTGPHLLPDHADVPAGSARWGCSATCRRSSRSASSSPIDTVELGDAPWEDKALVQTVAQEIRARIQENLHRDARQKRKSVWFG